MTIFWLAVIGLLTGVAGFIFWPVIALQVNASPNQETHAVKAGKGKVVRHQKVKYAELEQQASLHKQRNIEIFKERLAELEAEKAQGNLEADAFALLKVELEKSLLNDVAVNLHRAFQPVTISAKHWLISGLMTLAVIIWSLGLYAVLGRSDDYNVRLAMQAQGTLKHLGDEPAGMASAGSKPIDLNKAIELLKTKIQEDPKNVGKWFLLANSYAATEQYAKAAETFLEIQKLIPKGSPDYATVKGSYAQVLYLADDEKVTPQVKTAIADTLAIDSTEPNALTLKGVEMFEQGQYKQAIGFWEEAKAKANPRLLAQFIEPSINAAEAKLGLSPVIAESQPALASADNNVKIQVQVDIAPELKAKVSAEQVVFVFARPVGSKMPLAAERLTVKDLPVTITLDDTKSPMPTAKLSSVDKVDITARISMSGQPMQQPGDMFAAQDSVAVRADSKVNLLINQIVK